MPKKVLVRSRFRQPTVKTTRDWSRGKDGKLIEISGFRQFENHHCYMTPKEAAFIIDSEENQLYINAGLPPVYYYPAGAPLMVDDSKDGPLEPPLSGKGLATNSPQQAAAARRAQAEGELALARKAQDLREKVSQRPSTAQRVEAPEGADNDETDYSRPADAFGQNDGGKPMKISNPDLHGDEEVDAPVTFAQ
jgi:hypothetical protein